MSASTDGLPVRRTAAPAIFPQSLGERPLATQRRPAIPASAMVIALLSPLLALRSRNVQRVLFAMILLDIPLQLGTHLYYREADAAAGALAGLSISATTIALLALYLSWLAAALQARRRRRWSVQQNWALLMYLGFSALSVFVARDVKLSLFELFFLLQMYLVFLYVGHFTRTREDVLFVVYCLLAGCLVESIVIIALGFGSLSPGVWGPLHIRADEHSEFTRIGGTIGSPNEAGAYLSAELSVAMGVLFAKVSHKSTWLAAAVLAMGSAALIFTFSRGAWISIGVAMILFACSLAHRRRIPFKLVIPVAAILLLLYVPFHDAISSRLFSDDNGAAESRVPLMKLALRMIADNPILGVGSNNFSAAMGDYVTSEFRRGFLYTVHNKYLLVWSEIGPGGLLAYLAFFIGVLRVGRDCWRRNDSLLSMLALGFTLAIAGNMLHQTVEILQDRAITQLLWVFAGLLLVIQRILREPGRSYDSLSSIT